MEVSVTLYKKGSLIPSLIIHWWEWLFIHLIEIFAKWGYEKLFVFL